MNKSAIVALFAGGIAVTALGAVASYRLAGSDTGIVPPQAGLSPSAVTQTNQPQPALVPSDKSTAPRPTPPKRQFADVLAVRPVTEAIQTPREECRDEVVTHTAPTKDPNQITGTIAGAVVGGVVGHQFGGGSGKKLATVAGAVAGGFAGNQVQEKIQESDTYTTTERRCTTVTDTREQIVGYDVTYHWNGKDRVVRMDQPPGSRILVRNGQPVTDGSRATS